MSIKVILPQDYKTSQWSGGVTTQLVIFPPCEEYQDRNFLFRISTATCTVEKSEFTPLPAYNRILSVIKGGITLLIEDRNIKKEISPLSMICFGGEEKVSSIGMCTDFNVMTNKEKAKASLESFDMKESSSYSFFLSKNSRAVIYCCCGELTILEEGFTQKVKSGFTAEICDSYDRTITIKTQGAATFFKAVIDIV